MLLDGKGKGDVARLVGDYQVERVSSNRSTLDTTRSDSDASSSLILWFGSTRESTCGRVEAEPCGEGSSSIDDSRGRRCISGKSGRGKGE